MPIHTYIHTYVHTYIMSSSNKIISLINNRSFLGLLLNPVIRRFLVFIVNEPKRSFFIKFLAGLLFDFWSPDFSLSIAYVKSEQFGHKSGPERGGGTSGAGLKPLRGSLGRAIKNRYVGVNS